MGRKYGHLGTEANRKFNEKQRGQVAKRIKQKKTSRLREYAKNVKSPSAQADCRTRTC